MHFLRHLLHLAHAWRSRASPGGTGFERSGSVLQTSSPDRGTDSAEPLSNCREMLDERVQVQWSMHDDMVEIQLSARIREDQYVAFGLSGEQGR